MKLDRADDALADAALWALLLVLGATIAGLGFAAILIWANRELSLSIYAKGAVVSKIRGYVVIGDREIPIIDDPDRGNETLSAWLGRRRRTWGRSDPRPTPSQPLPNRLPSGSRERSLPSF